MYTTHVVLSSLFLASSIQTYFPEYHAVVTCTRVSQCIFNGFIYKFQPYCTGICNVHVLSGIKHV